MEVSTRSWCLVVSGYISACQLASELGDNLTHSSYFCTPEVTEMCSCVIFFRFHICHCFYESLQVH